jgi:hypothetical protein
MKMIKQTFKASILASAIAGVLYGCGGASQDGGQGDVSTSLNGLVIDGYLAGAIVWVDSNENHELDSFEQYALTDVDGYFTHSKPQDTQEDGMVEDPDNPGMYYYDYCSYEKGTTENLFCLDTTHAGDTALVVTTGGYDTTSGEKFEGLLLNRLGETGNSVQAAKRAIGDVDDPLGSNAENWADQTPTLSPVSTMLSYSDDPDALAQSLGITPEQVNTDFLDTSDDDSDDEDASAAKNILRSANATVQVALDSIANVADPNGELDDDQKNQMRLSVMRDFAEKAQNTGATKIEDVVSEQNITEVAEKVAKKVVAAVQSGSTFEEADETTVELGDAVKAVAEEVAKQTAQQATFIKETYENATPETQAAVNNIIESSKKLTVNSAKTLANAAKGSTSVQAIQELATQQTQNIDSFKTISKDPEVIESLNTNNVSLNEVTNTDFTNTSVEDIKNKMVLPDDAVIANPVGKGIVMFLADLGGSNPVEKRIDDGAFEEGRVYVDFLNDVNATEKGGPLKVCIYYNKPGGDAASNTYGTILDGNWSRGTNTRLYIKLNIGGGVESTIMSGLGVKNLVSGGTAGAEHDYQTFRFDFGGKLSDWAAFISPVDDTALLSEYGGWFNTERTAEDCESLIGFGESEAIETLSMMNI